jgi:hypothetical protein
MTNETETVQDIEPYKTSDTPLAAYLHLRGIILLTTRPDPNDRKRQIYVFVDEPGIAILEAEFSDDFGEFKSYFWSLKTVQRMLYKNNDRTR